MRPVWTIFLLVVTSSFILPVGAAPITKNIEGSLTLGGGTVTGFVTYNDSTGTTGVIDPINGIEFVPTEFELSFSNGPTLTLGALPPDAVDIDGPRIEVDGTTGDLLGFDWVILFLSGFGIVYDPLDPSSDWIDFSAFSSTAFLFNDAAGTTVAEGSIRFVSEAQAPAPATAALIGLGILLAGYRSRRRNIAP